MSLDHLGPVRPTAAFGLQVTSLKESSSLQNKSPLPVPELNLQALVPEKK